MPPTKVCECGCGLPAPISDKTRPDKGYIKGHPMRFVRGHYRKERIAGYRRFSTYKHPRYTQVPEHILVAERALGGYLPKGAEVHHLDEVPTNNENRNLVICQDRAYHKLLHARTRILKAGGDPNTEKICSRCKKVKSLSQFNRMTSSKSFGRQSACRECQKNTFASWFNKNRELLPNECDYQEAMG